MNFIKLQSEVLDLNKINELIVHESCGGVAFFIGTTRDYFEDKKVLSLEYESYDSMAIKSMTTICDAMRSKWTDIQNIAIYHRLGEVPVKEASVIIGVCSPHRKTCLEAVQFGIDELKKTVPIWKKEKYRDPEVKTKSKKLKINFDECPILDDGSVDKNLIQIHANESEINRRVNCFVERKREEIDLNNVKDFIEHPAGNPETDEYSCARVNSSVVYRSKDSNTHLKVHRVKNEYGPQTNQNYKKALDKLMDPSAHSPQKIKKEFSPNYATSLEIIEDRCKTAEAFLNIGSANIRNISDRLKQIENRILYLETISPEYNHFLLKSFTAPPRKVQKKTYSVLDLDYLIKDLQNKAGEDS